MIEKEKIHSMLFLNLVIMFQTAAMQQMGKLKNPMSDKIERDMEQARMSIDMLDMLAEKTKGNLSEDENKFLTSLIDELKLNYIDEVNKDKKAAEGAEAKNEPQPEAETTSS